VRTLVHLLIALTIGVGSLKVEFPTTPAADYNEVARRFFHGLAGVLFFGSDWIIVGGRELADLYATRRADAGGL
jgi:hypothetical protein